MKGLYLFENVVDFQPTGREEMDGRWGRGV
jgi:hypothetical protein